MTQASEGAETLVLLKTSRGFQDWGYVLMRTKQDDSHQPVQLTVVWQRKSDRVTDAGSREARQKVPRGCERLGSTGPWFNGGASAC